MGNLKDFQKKIVGKNSAVTQFYETNTQFFGGYAVLHDGCAILTELWTQRISLKNFLSQTVKKRRIHREKWRNRQNKFWCIC